MVGWSVAEPSLRVPIRRMNLPAPDGVTAERFHQGSSHGFVCGEPSRTTDRSIGNDRRLEVWELLLRSKLRGIAPKKIKGGAEMNCRFSLPTVRWEAHVAFFNGLAQF